MIRLLLLVFLFHASLVRAEHKAEHYADREDVRAFIAEMRTRHGFEERRLDALFRQTRPIAAVIKYIMPPKDPGVRSWKAYRARFIEPRRIAAGRRFMASHGAALAEAEARYGVPASVIAAIIGVETIYGKHMGNFQTFAALTTLAFDYPPRADLFRKELEELLLLARDQQRDPLSYAGSYAGALGLPQFLPSSWRRHAVDFDGDGRIDLAASPLDAIGSVAHFLAAHGWEKDAPIADPADADAAGGDGIASLLAEGIAPRRGVRELLGLGVALKVGAGETASSERPAALIDLASPDAPTEYRLGYKNFWVITRYNRSSFYAASVMDLAKALQ